MKSAGAVPGTGGGPAPATSQQQQQQLQHQLQQQMPLAASAVQMQQQQGLENLLQQQQQQQQQSASQLQQQILQQQAPPQPTGRMPGTPNAIVTTPLMGSAPVAGGPGGGVGGLPGQNLPFPIAAPRASRGGVHGRGGVPLVKPTPAMAAKMHHHFHHHGKVPPHYYPNLSGSETDVSTSTENLTQVKKAFNGS